MQHTLTPFLIRALSKTEGEKKEKRQARKVRRGRVREKREGKGERAEYVALISWQFGTGPDSPGKATDVSEPVRHARREGAHTHTHTHTSVTCVYTHSSRANIYTDGNAHK